LNASRLPHDLSEKSKLHMMRLPTYRHLLPTLALGGALALSGGLAEAGHSGGGHSGGGGHFSGGAHFSGHVSGGFRSGGFHASGSFHAVGSFRGGFARPGVRSRGWYGRGGYYGRGWYGGYYSPWAWGYGYPYAYETPAYYYGYGATYYPVQPAYAPPPPPAIAHHHSLPTFGIGVFAGASNNNDNTDQQSTEVGALGRIRLGQSGLLIEGEIAKMSFKNDERVDRRLGGSLIYEIGAHNSFAPYILAGGGVEQASVDGSFTTTQDYGEVGVGVRLALSRNLSLTADIRAGRRTAVDSDQPVAISDAARTVAPPSGLNGSSDTEDYTRGRIAAILNF
jgi:hypothetical protein